MTAAQKIWGMIAGEPSATPQDISAIFRFLTGNLHDTYLHTAHAIIDYVEELPEEEAVRKIQEALTRAGIVC